MVDISDFANAVAEAVNGLAGFLSDKPVVQSCGRCKSFQLPVLTPLIP
jgi:hypothetical protein